MYEKYYKLKTKPFQLTPDARFFYGSRGHKRAMAYLLYGVKQSEGFIVVTGNVGTGKTTLVQNLLRVLEKENVVAAQIVTTQIHEDDLLRMVAASFGLPIEGQDKASLLKNLEAFFKACQAEGKRALLVIDEAQNLPGKSIEELRMLSNFQSRGRSLVQSFLLGQKEFRVTMRSPGFEQLRQRVIAAYHLRPLDLEETRGYVRHRLKKVGWKDDPQIAEDSYEGIFAFTDGIPRRINNFCDRLLLHAYLEELHFIDRAVVDAVAADIAEEQGGDVGDLVDTGAPIGLHSIPTQHPNQPLEEPGKERLDEVEASVSALSDAMRDELSALRQTLNEFTKAQKDSDGK